jgi:hypothetical protein
VLGAREQSLLNGFNIEEVARPCPENGQPTGVRLLAQPSHRHAEMMRQET